MALINVALIDGGDAVSQIPCSSGEGAPIGTSDQIRGVINLTDAVTLDYTTYSCEQPGYIVTPDDQTAGKKLLVFWLKS